MDMPNFQSTKSSFILCWCNSSTVLLSAFSWQCVWVQGIFVFTVTGFDNVYLHHRLLIIHRIDFGYNFIQCLTRKSKQINKAAARLFTHLSAVHDIDFLLLSFPSLVQLWFVLMCGQTFIHSL